MIAFLDRRRVAIPATLALVVLGLTILGDFDPGGWVVLAQAFDHQTFTSVLICVLLIVALLGMRSTNWWLNVSKNILAVSLALAVPVVLWLSSFFAQDLRVQQNLAAPDGRPYRLVIAQGHDLMDPVSTLTIRTGKGIHAREWPFGCLDGEGAYDGLRSAVWNGPAEVVVTIGDDDARRRVVVPINTRTGRPSGSANAGSGCDD